MTKQQKFLFFCHFEASKIYKFLNFHGSEKKFRWPKHLFHIFPTYRKSISINRTNSHVHTTRRSEQSAKKLKFDAATYTFKITMFISSNILVFSRLKNTSFVSIRHLHTTESHYPVLFVFHYIWLLAMNSWWLDFLTLHDGIGSWNVTCVYAKKNMLNSNIEMMYNPL